tara:strand:- start:448 stop:918 length:471 start_codon:yes stop_codon:yes gene_type:complete
MAQRKVSHHKRIKGKNSISYTEVKKGFIIEFQYRNNNSDNYDKKPLVFVLFKKGKIVSGFNISYLKEYKIQLLLDDFQRMRGERKGNLTPELKRWPLFKKAYRTYSEKQMKLIKKIDWETDEDRARNNKIKVEEKLNDLNLEEPENQQIRNELDED